MPSRNLLIPLTLRKIEFFKNDYVLMKKYVFLKKP